MRLLDLFSFRRSPSPYRGRRSENPLGRWCGIAFRCSLLLLPFALLLVGLFNLMASWLGMGQYGLASLPPTRPSTLVVDPYHQFSRGQHQRLERHLAHLNESLQSDWTLVVLPKTDARAFRSLAEDLFQRWQVGRDAFNQRGALMLVTTQPPQATLVMGDDLGRALKGSGVSMLNLPLGGGSVDVQPVRLSSGKETLADSLHATLALLEKRYARMALAWQGEMEKNPLTSQQLASPLENVKKRVQSLPLRASLVLPPDEDASLMNP